MKPREEAAQSWAKEDIKSMSESNDNYGISYHGRVKGFVAGIEWLEAQSSEGFHDWYYVGKDCTAREFKSTSNNIFYKLEECWQASRLSAQKEIAEKDKQLQDAKDLVRELVMIGSFVDSSRQAPKQLEEKIKSLLGEE